MKIISIPCRYAISFSHSSTFLSYLRPLGVKIYIRVCCIYRGYEDFSHDIKDSKPKSYMFVWIHVPTCIATDPIRIPRTNGHFILEGKEDSRSKAPPIANSRSFVFSHSVPSSFDAMCRSMEIGSEHANTYHSKEEKLRLLGIPRNTATVIRTPGNTGYYINMEICMWSEHWNVLNPFSIIIIAYIFTR